jgi:hypothetical protein
MRDSTIAGGCLSASGERERLVGLWSPRSDAMPVVALGIVVGQIATHGNSVGPSVGHTDQDGEVRLRKCTNSGQKYPATAGMAW